ncbi:cadherin-like and PC-esterase domain-containing protein 1 [Daphnia carinata]|uniref:cadherin-like and PC-esterase domain-containing protein 1 n=1 Tax=Daphnia carinata TaxID=120202 RepID=UPI00257D59AF|nr:cadherin-like and PC-esterase domain-containing protein 1 [Daphnia carinata]
MLLDWKMRRCYTLFIGLMFSGVFALFLMAKREAEHSSRNWILDEEEIAYCEWKMMHDPAMRQQSSNHERWNVSLLLSLGLLAPKTSYGFNGSSMIYPDDKQICREYDGQMTSQLTLKRILGQLSSNADSWCQTLRNVTGRVSSCYDLNSNLDEFLTSEHSLSKTWHCFHPSETKSQTLTTLQIYQAIRLKRFSTKETVVIPVPEDNLIGLPNSTLIFRLFFLIGGLDPPEIYTFNGGLLLLDQENSFKQFGCSALQQVCDSAARWIQLVLNHVEKSPQVHEFKLLPRDGKVSQIIAADFIRTPSDTELLRIHHDVHRLRTKSTPHFLHLLLHKTISIAVRFLSVRRFYPATKFGSALNEHLYDEREIFGLIHSLVINPFIKLEPTFHSRWTHYSATVPYEMTWLNLQVFLNDHATYALVENQRAKSFKISIGLGWNDFKIEIGNKDTRIRSITYILRIRRLPREDNPIPFCANNLTVCILEQECSLKFKEKAECGLQASPFGNWNSALTDWDRLPTCPFGNTEEGAWMIPCSSCLLERSCYWSRARWQPFECRHPHYSPSKVKQCLLHRKLIFVGDSTNRGMMESLLERLDGWLTTSDRTKWHGYRHRLANTGGQTQFDFDYYPKFWMSSRTSLEQTLTHMLRRVAANESDTTLIIGGLDWMSVEHFETIQRVLAAEGLSRMAVVIKMAGAGQSDVTATHGEKGLVSTARRLARLSQTARLHYGFRTVDTWNMTVAKFRDFLPGRCRCHFHQITEVAGDSSDADAINLDSSSGSSPRRFSIDGSINQVYTEILADQICRR